MVAYGKCKCGLTPYTDHNIVIDNVNATERVLFNVCCTHMFMTSRKVTW